MRQNKMKFSVTEKILAACLASAVLISCRTLHEPKTVYEPLNYTEQDIYDAEVKRITSLAETSPVEALWSAELLKDEAARQLCAQKVEEKYRKAVDDRDYYAALTYCRSLDAAGEGETEYGGMTRQKLEEEFTKNIPGLTPEKEYLPKTIQDCINATVTVWVDRGISIKNGAGYADRVIGSGFFIDRKGYIVTNHHVIADIVDPKNEKYSRLYVKLASDTDTRIPAKVVGYDAVLDLALLKAEVDAPFVLSLGSSADLSIGDKVSAIGTPLGLDGTLTQGIVSAISRKLFTTGSVLQIDAAVNSGNSGGPLIDSQMRVQAIVFAGMLQYQGLNFAIPVEYLRQDLPMMYHGGKREHPWTGSYGHTKKSGDGRTSEGLEVQYVMPGGSASRAGFSENDVITSVNGTAVSSIEDMQDILRNYIPGTIIRCAYMNAAGKGERLVYLEDRPENPGYTVYQSDLLTGSFVPIFGMKLINASTMNRHSYAVTEIIKGGIADESGFSVNDPITVSDVKFSDDSSSIYAELYTRKSKKGFLDIAMGMTAALDSPYYF
jgi:S1-C subfamily serine protease